MRRSIPAALVMALAVMLSACGGSPAKAVTAPTTQALPTTTIPPGTDVAHATVASLPIYSAPGATSPTQSLSNPNSLNEPLVLLVKSVQLPWVQAYLPERPNEDTGWVMASDVTLTSDPYRIDIALGARQLTVFKGTKQVMTAAIAPGAPSSPTPTGYFFVSEIIQVSDPGGPYGPWALGLSAFSNVYTTFDGGPGQVAIHGTNQPNLIGTYASHGCVRMFNWSDIALAQLVPDGTPVTITA